MNTVYRYICALYLIVRNVGFSVFHTILSKHNLQYRTQLYLCVLTSAKRSLLHVSRFMVGCIAQI